MGAVKLGDTVRVHYTGKLPDGTVFDSSSGRDPLEFKVGSGKVIRGFERAVVGLKPGQSVKSQIPCADAYGPWRKEMTAEVERSKLPAHITPEIGRQLRIKRSDDRTFLVRVLALTESSVTLDSNHPLAGKDLTFEIELVAIV